MTPAAPVAPVAPAPIVDTADAKPARGFQVAAVAAAVWFGAQAGRHFGFVVDDAAISFAVARTLGTTFRLELAPGVERVEPATNLLWCLLLSPFAALHIDLALVASFLGVVCSGLAIYYVCALPSRVAGRAPRLRDTLGGFLAASLAPYATWSVSGLENGLLSLILVRALLAMADEEQAPQRFPRSAWWLFAAFLTRPDAGLYAAAFGLAKLVRVLVSWRVRRQDMLFVTTFAAAVLAVTGFRQMYFAWPVPMSFYAKQGGLGVGTELFDFKKNPGFGYAGGFLRDHNLNLLVCAVPLVLWGRKGHATRLAWALSVAVMFAVVVLSHGDWMEQFRLLTFAIPLLSVAGTSGVMETLFAFVAPRARFARALCSALSCAAAGYLVHRVLTGFELRAEASRAHGTIQKKHVEDDSLYFESFAHTLGLAETGSLYDADIGGIALRAKLRVLDHFGLADVASARLFPEHHGELRAAIFGERAPSFVRLHGVWVAHTRLLDAPFFERAYLRLPFNAPGAPSLGDHNFVRRELVATPLPRAAQLFPSAAAPKLGQLMAATLSAQTVPFATPVYAELFVSGAVTPAQLGAIEVRAPQKPDAIRVPLTSTASGISSFHARPGEAVRSLATLNLPPGVHTLEFVAVDKQRTPLGTIRVLAPKAPAGKDLATPENRVAHDPVTLGPDAAAEAGRLHTLLDEGKHKTAQDTRLALGLRAHAQRWLQAGAPRLAVQIARYLRPLAVSPATQRVLDELAREFASAARVHQLAGKIPSAFDLALESVLLDPHRAQERRRAELLRLQRVTRFDADRSELANDAARAAIQRTYPVADAMKWLGSVERDSDAVTLYLLTGAPDIDDDARRVLARGQLVRGELNAALASLRGLRACADGDAELAHVAKAVHVVLPVSCVTPRNADPLDDDDGSFERGNLTGYVGKRGSFAADQKALLGQNVVTGFRGRYFANSFQGGDKARGTLRTRTFEVTAPAYSFLVAGGNTCKDLGVRFVVAGEEAQRACGENSEALRRVFVDAREFQGKEAYFELYDDSTAAWGHVLVDDIRPELAAPPRPAP